MSRTKDQANETVDLLLKRILRRELAASWMRSAFGVSAGLALGCGGNKAPADTQNTQPAVAGDGDGSLQTDATWPEASAPGTDGGRDVAGLPTCTAEGQWQPRAAALRTRETFDYLSVRERRGVSLDDGTGAETWMQSTFTLLSEHGTQCEGASQPACLQKVQKHPDELVGGSCTQLCSERSVVTTRGEQVERWAGTARLTALLGPIDVEDEALLLAFAAGYDVPCDQTAELRAVDDGFELFGKRITNACDPVETTGYRLSVSAAGQVRVLEQRVIASQAGLCIGRVPAGLTSTSQDMRGSVLGDYLAHCAHLEAASVTAFERLARELLAHGAPTELVEAALSAATDEVRHAALLGKLAEVRGGRPSAPQVDPLPLRALEEIARENAVEGCVRETYGALVGAYQAEHAQDPELARLMRTIADDEARHAVLSHDVDRWAREQLGERAWRRVEAARQQAILQLEAACGDEPDAQLLAQAGLPPAALARAFVGELCRSLWGEPPEPARVGMS